MRTIFIFQKDLTFIRVVVILTTYYKAPVKIVSSFLEYFCIFILQSVQELIYLFGVLHHFQHCTCHITTGSWKGRGNQYIQFVRVLYCKLNGKQLPAFPLEEVMVTEPQPQKWKARVLPLCHRGPVNPRRLCI